MLLGDALNWAKYRVWKPVEFAAGDAAKAAAGSAVRGAGRAAWGGAKFGARMGGRAAVWGAKNVAWPSLKQGANLAVNTGLQAGHVLWNWGMGGEGLFKVVDNPNIANALRAGASPNVLRRLGYAVDRKAGETAAAFAKRQASSMQMLTFNPTLRKRMWHGAIAVAAISSLRATGGHDPRVALYDESGIRERGNMGADGDLALSMYYNNR